MSIKSLVKKLRGTEGIDTAVLDDLIAEGDRLSTESLEASNAASAANTKAAALEKTVEAIAAAAGIEGDDLSGVAAKVGSIATEHAQLTTDKTNLEEQLADASGKAEKLERGTKLREYAETAQADPVVFNKLFADRYDEIKVDDGTVKIGEKPLSELVDEDSTLTPFKASLFTSKKEDEKPKGGLPKGGGNGDSQEKASPLKSYMSKRYAKAS